MKKCSLRLCYKLYFGKWRGVCKIHRTHMYLVWLASWLSRNMEYLQVCDTSTHWDLWLWLDKCYGFTLGSVEEKQKLVFGKSSAQSWPLGAVIEAHCQEQKGGCCLGLKEGFIQWGKSWRAAVAVWKSSALHHVIKSKMLYCSSTHSVGRNYFGYKSWL